MSTPKPRITVVHKDGSLTAEPMTEDLLYKLRRHGQLTTEQLRQHLAAVLHQDSLAALPVENDTHLRPVE